MKKENLEVLLEDMNSKFSLILEGHEAIRSEVREGFKKADERFDLIDFKIETLNKKIDAVSADLAAHRSDTEAHHAVYRVRESE
jgi:hypothetical protein